MAKVNIKSEKITPFGGIYYARLSMRFHLTKSSTALLVFAVPPTTVCLPLYRRMRQMDKDGKKLVAECVYRHAV